jgi:ribonuclease P protein component
VIAAAGTEGVPCVGFVAGRRVGSAVERNRAKRRLREAASLCPLQPDTVYVLVAERGVLTADFDSLVDWIGTCTGEKTLKERT